MLRERQPEQEHEQKIAGASQRTNVGDSRRCFSALAFQGVFYRLQRLLVAAQDNVSASLCKNVGGSRTQR